MNIKPEEKSVQQLFPVEKSEIYKIPIYQRNYSWKNTNIEELFNDITSENKGYYCGNLLVTISEDNFLEPEGLERILDIVDGQQRLTTIAMFLFAVYERFKELYATDATIMDTKKYAQLSTDIPRKLLFNEKHSVIQLLGNDKIIWTNYLRKFENKEPGRFGNLTFDKRYKFIKDLISDYNIEELQDFYEKLNSLKFLRILVENISDAYSVFTSLNFKGVPLTLLDLLKSSFLSKAIKSIEENEAVELWEKLVDVFKLNDEHNITHVTQFLLNNYDTFENHTYSSITKGAALKHYQDIFSKKGYTYMNTLIKRAKEFTYIHPNLNPSSDVTVSSKIINKLNSLKKLESSQLYPVLLYLLDKNILKEISDEELDRILTYLISFFVRRNLVQKPKSSNIRAKTIEVVRNLSKENKLNVDSTIDFYSYIKSSFNSISVDDEMFLASLNDTVYDINPSTTRFMLISIERYFSKNEPNIFNKQTPDNLDAFSGSGNSKKYVWTLEHILPQNKKLSDNWKNMISPDDLNAASELQEVNVHKLGNLTLTGYNSELSDSDFEVKRDYIAPGSDNFTGLRTNLFLNRSIPDLKENETIESKDSWTIKDIERRTEYLSSKALEIFNLE